MEKRIFLTLMLTGIALIYCGCKSPSKEIDRSRDFDAGWLFMKDSMIDASVPGFDDSQWRKLDLPHDWSIEDLPGQEEGKVVGPFSLASEGGMNTGYFVGGTAWYRKRFSLDPSDKEKIVWINFDGVYMDCDIWLNGEHLGNHPYGYTPFNFDLTKYLKPAGEENIIAVRVRNLGLNSRWYTGSGIYRHVTLYVADPVHVSPWGIYITTHMDAAGTANVLVNTTVENSYGEAREVKLVTKIISGESTTASATESPVTIEAQNKHVFNQTITVTDPLEWSIETPHLYTAEVEVYSGETMIDKVAEKFGIRTLEFSPESGFLLNGKQVLLKGGCIHHDNGMLGAVTFDRAEERRVELMKAYGFNAIRTSHNPPSRQFLDACDRLGIVVIDEAFDMWERPKNPQDYARFFKSWWQKDIESMILRDRNHPSIIIWSIGNEINERADSSGIVIGKNLSEEMHRLDPTRPVTAAICEFWDHRGRPWEATEPAFEILDIGGYNYQWRRYNEDHKKFPERIMAGTESFAIEAFENWQMVEKNPWVIGDFIWTAMDYMGETAIGHSILDDQKNDFRLPWPWYNAFCGDIDLIGLKKPQLYYRDVIWNNSKIEMLVHTPIPPGRKEIISGWGWPDEWPSWNWKGHEGEELDVRIFTKCSKVRLELNGKIIGEQSVSENSKLIASFKVPYEAGILKAVGLENGIETCTKILSTAGDPALIRLIPDRREINADRNDLAYVKVEVTDDMGNVVPDVQHLVRFNIQGYGELAAAGSACPNEMASFQKPECRTWHGIAMVIIRPTGIAGTIHISATSEGLKESEVNIAVK